MNAFERIANGKPACLAQAALEYAADEYPDLDIAVYTEKLNDMIERFQTMLGRETCEPAILEQLNRYFFGDLGFSGNKSNYYDPRNSYLNEVIDRRLGIPISLSVIYQTIARSVGLPLIGINVPGHFMLALQARNQSRRLYIDVFNGGQTLDWNECRDRILPMIGSGPCLCESDLPSMSSCEILTRMLRNLKGIYSRTDRCRCLRIQQRIVELQPEDPVELRELGLLFFHAGRPMHAMQTLQRLLEVQPDFAEDGEIADYLVRASREAALLN